MQPETANNISDSDISASLNIEMDPKNIEVKETPSKVFIGRDNWKKFIVGTSIATLFMTFFLIVYTVMYFIDEKLFKKMFKNFSRPGNGYDIGAYIVFVICFILPSVLPHISRKLAFLLILPITICFAYIPAFLIRVAMKERFNFSEFLVCGYTVYFCATIGLFVNVMMTKNVFKADNGIIIAVGLNAVLVLLYVYVLNLFNPYKWHLLLIVASSGVLAAYLNFDMHLMIKKRSDYYLNDDWFLGFIHLHTDIFFRFWRDIFRPDSVLVDTSIESNRASLKASNIKESDLETIDEETTEEH